VIDGANELRVTFQDQEVYPAAVVGFDEDKDIAVLQVDLTKAVTKGVGIKDITDKSRAAPRGDRPRVMRPLPIGTSSDLLVGQRVYAIGNPFGRGRGGGWRKNRSKHDWITTVVNMVALRVMTNCRRLLPATP